MDVRFLLLLVCLCTLSSRLPVLALHREASTLDTASVEFVRRRSSHGSHSQEESRQEGFITIHHSERRNMQSSTNAETVHARRLLSLRYRQIMASQVQNDEGPKNKVNKPDPTLTNMENAGTKPLGDTGHENLTNNKTKSGDKEKGMSSAPPHPPATPEGKDGEVNNTAPIVDDQSTKNNTHPEFKPNAPAIHCGDSHCEDPTKLVSACLLIPGDGAHKLSLFITNVGDSQVLVKVVAPEYLVARPPDVSVSKGKSETIQFLMDSKHELSTLVLEAVNKTITVITDDGKCEIAVPLEYLRSSVLEQKPRFSSYLPSVTSRVVAYLVALLLVVALVGAWFCYKCCWKKRARDVKYQQLEMIVPGQSTPKERDEQHVEGWDEVWDDDWEDAEAAKSSSRLTQNLSSRGLGARRGNKDGWDNSWDD